MAIRERVLVAVGFAVLVGVAAIGGRAYLGADTRLPEDWEVHDIQYVALSHDRRTVHVMADPQIGLDCHDARAEIDTSDAQRWTVTLEARRTREWCNAAACIDPSPPPPGPAVTIAPDEELPCATTRIQLTAPVPDEVEVVAA